MTLVRWQPTRRNMMLRNDLNRFFEHSGFDYENSDKVWSPSVDLSETEKGYEVMADLPGMKKDEIKISFTDNVLTLTGEKKEVQEEDGKSFHRVERTHGRFERSFRLPKDIKAEKIKASYNDGVLNIEIPKAEEVKPKEIEVS